MRGFYFSEKRSAAVNQVYLWVGAILSGIYGLLTAFAGLTLIRTRKVPVWAAWSFFLCGLLVVAAGILTLFRSGSALWVLVIGLLGIHALAINNGFKLFGKINPAHHLARLLISALLMGLTYLGLG
jgi:hypothetical protein